MTKLILTLATMVSLGWVAAKADDTAGKDHTAVAAPAPVARPNSAVAVPRLPNQSRTMSGLRNMPIIRSPTISRLQSNSLPYPNSLAYTNANWRLQNRRHVAANLPSQSTAQVPTLRTPDAADEILRTIRHRSDLPNQPRQSDLPREANNVAPRNAPNRGPGERGATERPKAPGSADAQPTNAAFRHRGKGTPVVSFNNNNSVDWNDACRRHHNHHDRDWWCHNFTTIILVTGGYYAWDNGWWYPAWGYDPYYASYSYDGPIYGYDGLAPDQVIANVQGALQELGYFPYAVDGVLGPVTRQAIAAYQQDNGLLVTGAVDRATLVSLGFILG